MNEKQYNDYTLSEKTIYAKGWNDAIRAASKLAEDNNTSTASTNQIRSLDKSIQACDD